jgi:hypothetical protein
LNSLNAAPAEGFGDEYFSQIAVDAPPTSKEISMSDDLVARGRRIITGLDAIATAQGGGPRGQAASARAFRNLSEADQLAYRAAKSQAHFEDIEATVRTSQMGEQIRFEVAQEKYRQELREKVLVGFQPAKAAQPATVSVAARPSSAPTVRPTAPAHASNSHEPSAVTKARAEAFEAGRQMVRDLAQTVFASEHFAGRSQMAAKLIANPKLDAAEIIGLLADMPDSSGDTIFAAMMARQSAGDERAGHVSAAETWKRAHASVNTMQGPASRPSLR